MCSNTDFKSYDSSTLLIVSLRIFFKKKDMKKVREDYIDYVKVFGLILLLLSHSMDTTTNYIGEWVTSFNMPIFFIICGFLLRLRFGNDLVHVNIVAVLKRRLWQLAIPYFVFCFLLVFMYIVLSYLSGGGEYTGSIFKESMFKIFSLQGIDFLWFIPCYFIVELLFLAILKYAKYPVCINLIICLVVVLGTILFGQEEMQWYYMMLLKIGLGLFFIISGYYISGCRMLLNYRHDGRYDIDNLEAERKIRPFTIGRKNTLFFGSEDGVEVATTYYTLIETAKLNGLSPIDYLAHVFRQLMEGNKDYESLLPSKLAL